jgi:hypothetical protein
MAAKLVVFKSTRPNTNVAFYEYTDAQRAELRASAPISVIGERVYADGLKKVRTLFFARVAHYDAWKASALVTARQADRAAYNAANGITEHEHVVDMPNYDLDA